MDAESMETMLSHRDRVNENILRPVCVSIRGDRGTRGNSEKRRAYRGRIGENRFYRSVDTEAKKLSGWSGEKTLVHIVSRVIRPENNRNNRCVARITAIPFVDRQRHIGFGMPFSSGDPLPVTSIY